MKTTLQRFMDKLEMDPDGCWYWKGGFSRNGYGQFSFNGNSAFRAHIASHEMFIGPVGEMIVCHKCDHPDCVNPFHLFLGTVKTNREDQESKGRHYFNQMKKIDPVTVLAILKSDGKQRDLAKKFGVSQVTISDIKSGKTWHYLTDAKKNPDWRAKKLTREVVLQIRNSTGSCREAGFLFGVSPGIISGIRRGIQWAHVT